MDRSEDDPLNDEIDRLLEEALLGDGQQEEQLDPPPGARCPACDSGKLLCDGARLFLRKGLTVVAKGGQFAANVSREFALFRLTCDDCGERFNELVSGEALGELEQIPAERVFLD